VRGTGLKSRMPDLPNTERARYGRGLALLALVLVSAAQMGYAAVHMDLARDLFIAWRSLHGEALPLSGPVLAGTIHLGAIWYWLLTALLAIGRGWLGAMLLLGVIASLQFPLAYLAGKELHSRRAGTLWACLLLVPSWSAFEWLLPLHYLLSSMCVLAFVLCAARYQRRPRRRYLIGMALSFVLALHAHPANAGLVWIGLALLVWAVRRGHCRGRDVLIAGGVGLLPLLPYFIWDASQGFADLTAGARFVGGEHTGHISAIGPLLAATAIGGTRYWFAVMLDWPAWAANSAVAATALVGVIGIVAALFATAAASTHRLGLAAFGAAAGIALTTALLRDMTPYYMTTSLHVVLVGIVAFGLASLRNGAIAASVRGGACLVAAAGFLFCATRAAHLQKHGDWPFNFFPLFNVSEAAQPTVPLLLMPAYGVAASGKFLCAEAMPDAHGALAQYLLHGYAVDMRLTCARSDVKLGGAEAGRRHWLGLSRALLARIGVQPLRRLGSIGIVAAHPLSAGPAIDPPASPVYPAYLPKFSPAPEERRLRIEPGADRHLAVSNIAFGFAPDAEVAVTLAGKALEPLAVDSVSRVYAIESTGDVEITIHSLDAPDVDVVTF
jgi:hypothetical protein